MMNSYVELILSYPTIKAGDIDGLDRFSLLLTNAGNVMLAVKPGAREMENTKTIRQIVAKLPFNLQERFRRLVDRSHDEEVSFQTLVDFLTEEVRITSHPIFGTKHLKADRQETHASGSGDKPKAGNGNKGKRAATKQEPGGAKGGNSELCGHCSKSRFIGTCSKLFKLPMEERVQVVKSTGVCFGCLHRGHVSRFCRQRAKCRLVNMAILRCCTGENLANPDSLGAPSSSRCAQ